MYKRGISHVITMLIMIALVLVAIGGVWVVVNNVIDTASKNVENQTLKIFNKTWQSKINVTNATCAQLGGTICTEEQYCSGNLLNATDTDRCCDATCEESTCTSCDTCGDGLFNICDRAECYACTNDTCYFLNRLITDECNSCTGATCESYDNDETTCGDDPCGLGSCLWSGSLCLTQTESQVTRGFSSTTVSAGEIVTVTLDVSIINSETFYAIEEYIPTGWTVINDGGGNTTNPNILKWAALDMTNPLPDTTYTYTVQAPASTGIFDGVYMFEGFAGTTPTKGQTTITVA